NAQELVETLRPIVRADGQEQLILIWNELFLGLIRRSARVLEEEVRTPELHNLLRQAVVVCCTALETYLPRLLEFHLPRIIRTRGIEFIREKDELVNKYLKALIFPIESVILLLNDVAGPPRRIAQKIISLTSFKYLSDPEAIHVVGALLGLPDPWEA